MRVMNNIPALQAYNALSATNQQLQKSIQKLSTGLRINSAADDAAGLAISEKMRAQIRGLDRAASNAQDGISMIGTAEGALNETHSILQRMRELSVQAANDTLTQEDRAYIQLEIDQLKEEITRISTTTQFNKKKLLDGSAAVLWSSDNLLTKAVINGGLRQIDQFGQKSAVEGNFILTISATPGQAEIQKSDIFKIKHKNVIMDVFKNTARGINDVQVDNLPAGMYTVKQNVTGLTGGWKFADQQLFGGADMDGLAAGAGSTTASENNASILFEVVSVNDHSDGTGSVTFRVQSNVLKMNGETESFTVNSFTLDDTGIAGMSAGTYAELGITINWNDLSLASDWDEYNVGDKIVLNYVAAAAGTDPTNILITAEIHQQDIWPNGWSNAAGNNPIISAAYRVNVDDMRGQEIQFKNFYLNEMNGTVYQGNIQISFDSDEDKFIQTPTAGTVLASFEAAFIGQVAKGDVRLYDLDKFWDANGKFMLDDPKNITLYQGNGNRTSITLYANDTLDDVRKKLDNAISQGLGQSQYFPGITDDDRPEFVSFVVDKRDAAGDQTGSGNYVKDSPMSVAGTFVIRSIVPGAAGRLSFSGDEDLIKALSLNVIQDARETQFTVDVDDAHKARNLAAGVKVTGNALYGVVNPNVDVEFDSMANIDVSWNGTKFTFAKANELYKTTIHLADNTTVFQIGANEGEDMGVNIGDMSAFALGVHNVLVTDRLSAARSITVIDNAIGRVSSQRAKLGAYQNRLEHTINNLVTASTNLTAAESRIRDVDMAKEMMNFTKLNILSMAGTSMLAQANMMPQNVLSLLR